MQPPFPKLKHDFEPSDRDPRYYGHWNRSEKVTAAGTLRFGIACGCPAVAHQDQPGEWR